MPLFFIDYWYIVLVVPVLIASLIIQSITRSTYRKYSGVQTYGGCTGADMARRILRENGISDVNVVPINGELSDHYDPKARVIKLSKNVYDGRSVASLGVASHEAGHAVQHATAYAPLTARNAFAPVAGFCSGISWYVLILGIFMQYELIINIGIILFAAAAVFQLITLPVEFNASRRAISALRQSNVMNEEELSGTKKVLTAAALTYVAALALSIASLIRVLMITKNRNGRD